MGAVVLWREVVATVYLSEALSPFDAVDEIVCKSETIDNLSSISQNSGDVFDVVEFVDYFVKVGFSITVLWGFLASTLWDRGVCEGANNRDVKCFCTFIVPNNETTSRTGS